MNPLELTHRHTIAFVKFTDEKRRSTEEEISKINRGEINVIEKLSQKLYKQITTLVHGSSVKAIAFNQNGDKIVSGTDSNELVLWNLNDYKEILKMKGHTDGITYVLFSYDNNKIISSSYDKKIIIWDQESGNQINILDKHNDSVNTLALTRDNKYLASGSEDKLIIIWNILNGKELFRLEDHNEGITSLCFSVNNEILISGGNSIKIWDMTKKDLIHSLDDHDYSVNSIAYSPDGLEFAFGGNDHTIKILNYEYLEERMVLFGHEDRVISISYSPDGIKLISSSYDSTIRIWFTQSGVEIKKLLLYERIINFVVFNFDGSIFASGSRDKKLILWDANSDTEKEKISGHNESVQCISLDKNGEKLVSGSKDGTIRIWNAETGKELWKMELKLNWVQQIAFSFDSNSLIGWGNEYQIIVWDINSKKEIRRIKTLFNSVLIDKRCKYISASFDKTIQIIDFLLIEEKTSFESKCDDLITIMSLNRKEEILAYSDSNKNGKIYLHNFERNIHQIFEGHQDRILALEFSDDGLGLVSSSSDLSIIIWDIENCSELYKITNENEAKHIHFYFNPKNSKSIIIITINETINILDGSNLEEIKSFIGHKNEINCLITNDEGQKIYSAGDDCTIGIWDSQTGSEINKITGHLDQITSIVFSIDDSKIASTGNDMSIRIWNTNTLIEIKRIDQAHDLKITSLSFLSKGTLVSGSADRKIKVWNIISGKMIREIEEAHDQEINCLAFSPITKKLASGSNDSRIKIWDPSTGSSGSEIKIIEIKGIIKTLVYSIDGKKLACGGSMDFLIRIFDAITGSELMKIEGHQGIVNTLQFTSDSNRIVSGSDDKTIRIFNAKSGSELKVIKGHKQAVTVLVINSDDSKIISGSKDCSIRTWNFLLGEEMIKKRIEKHEAEISALAVSHKGDMIISGSKDNSIIVCNDQSEDIIVCLSNFLMNKTGSINNILTVIKDLSFNYFNLDNYCFSFLHGLLFMKQYHHIFYLIDLLEQNNNIFKYFSVNSSPLEKIGKTVINLLIKRKEKFNDTQIREVLKLYLNSKINFKDFYEKPEFFRHLIDSAPFQEICLKLINSRFISPELTCEFNSPWKFQNIYKTSDYDFEDQTTNLSENVFEENKSIFGKIAEFFRTKKKKVLNSSHKYIYQLRVLDIPEITYISNDTIAILERISKFDITSEYFASPAISALVDFKWKKYGQKSFLIDFLKYIIFLIIVGINSLVFLPNLINDSKNSNTIILCGLFSTFIIIYDLVLIYNEIIQLKRQGKRRYWTNFWNWFDWISLSLILIASFLDFCECISPGDTNLDKIKTVHSIAFLLAWLRILDYFRGFKPTAIFIVIISQVIWDLKIFILILFSFLIGFTISLSILQQNNEYNIYVIFKAFYKLLLGDFDEFDSLYENGESNTLIWLIFLSSSLLLMIILLNLLIAIISDSYEKIMAGIRHSIVHERLNFLVDLERMMTEKEREKLNRTIKKYLVVAFKFDINLQVFEDEETSGRMRSQIDNLKTNFTNYKQVMDEKIKGIDEKLNEMMNILKNKPTSRNSSFMRKIK